MGRKVNLMDRVKTGNVVEEFYIGNTRIRICDDYCRDKTPEQVQEILDKIRDIALDSYARAARLKNENA